MTRLKLGLLGCGGFARTLTKPFEEFEDAEISAVYNRTFSKAEDLGQELGVPAFASVQELLAQEFVDAVIINTSHDQHKPMALAAATAGKHIFCEKPMALNVDECHDMISSAKEQGVKLFVGHVTRLLPLFARVKEIIDSDDIGKPLAIQMTRYWPVIRLGWWAKRSLKGGLLHSPASHEIDYLNYLCGKAASVHATAAPQIQKQLDYEDTIFLTVCYESGAVGSIAASISSGMPVQSGFIIGEAGGLKYDMYGPEGGYLEVKKTGSDESYREVLGDFGLDIGMRRELRNFVDYVLYETEPLLTAEGGLRTVEVMQAAYKSIREGHPISIPLDNQEL
jgi:predicted dehydrogenase